MNRTIAKVTLLAVGLLGVVALGDEPRGGWGRERREERREHGRRGEERRERERWERERWQRQQVVVAPTMAVPPAQAGGHYQVQLVRRWVPGRYEQVWVPGSCVGFGYARVCSQGQYQNVWRAGAYQDVQENVWVADPPCHDYGYGTQQVDPYSQNQYVAPTAYTHAAVAAVQVQVPGFVSPGFSAHVRF